MYEKLFSPGKIGKVETKNRLVMSPMLYQAPEAGKKIYGGGFYFHFDRIPDEEGAVHFVNGALTTNLCEYNYHAWEPAYVDLKLHSSPDDPWGELPINTIIGGAYSKNDLVVHKCNKICDLDAEELMPYLLTAYYDRTMPALMADVVLDKMPNVKWTIVALSLFAGIISAFVDNVATVLMVAPVAIAIARKFDISPVPMVIAISVSSNLQGAATLVGDTTSILLGGYAHMDFLDFFVFRGKPGMFWVVELGAFLTMFVLLWLFRKETQPTVASEHTVVHDFLPSILLGGAIVLLICASFIKHKPPVTNGLICMPITSDLPFILFTSF